jgi:hypothetical protein
MFQRIDLEQTIVFDANTSCALISMSNAEITFADIKAEHNTYISVKLGSGSAFWSTWYGVPYALLWHAAE